MIYTLIIIYWAVLVAMITSALFYKNYSNHQILGVTLSKDKSETKEVQEIIRSYSKSCYLLLLSFFALSLILLWNPMKPYVEFYMLILTFVLFLITGAVSNQYKDKLRALKEEKHWVYSSTQTLVVDTDASKEKGKSAIPIFWSWIFVVLSLLPGIYLLANTQARELFPIPFALIGPLCQLLMVYMYRQSLKHHTPVLSDNPEINKACARREEHINSLAATLIGLVMLLFWISFNVSIIYASTYILTGILVVVLVVPLLIIASWQQKKIHQVEEYFFETQPDASSNYKDGDIYEQESLWKWGFYNNPDDPRLFVPKRVASLGMTVNIGRPIGKKIMIGISVLIIGVLLLVFVGAVTDYDIDEKDSRITVSSAMYHTTFDASDLVSVEMLSDLPDSTRTNGFGGANKSFGHFHVDGYGSSMFYLYNDTDAYIVLQLKDNKQKYVFVNDKTIEETDELYEYFMTINK